MPIDAKSITWDAPTGIVWDDQKPESTGPSSIDRFLQGLRDPIEGGAQLLTHLLPSGVVSAGNRFNNWLADNTGIVGRLPEGGVDQQVRENEARMKSDGVDWARLAGNVLNPVNMAIGAGLPSAASLGGRALAGAAGGALGSSLAPVAGDSFAEDKAKQLAMGAAGGAVVPLVAGGLGRIISPKASTNPQVQQLTAAGVKPTIGQTLGGAANTAEEKAMSVPIFGDAIRAARGKARDQFNNAFINEAGKPIGVTVKGKGAQAVQEMHAAISKAYDAAKAQLGHFQLDRTAAQELSTLQQMTRNLPARERRAFDSIWSYLDQEVSPNGSILADGFKRFDSKAGSEAAKFLGSQDAYQKQAGDAIKELQRIIVDAGKRANPKASAALDAADAAFARLVRVEDAAKRAAAQDGVFTPGQAVMAVRSADRTARKNATAQGKALMQDLATSGQSVLGNKYPDSGTAGRVGLGMLGLGAGYMDPLIPLGLTAGAAGYSAPMQSAMRWLATARPQSAEPIAGLLNQTAPMLAPAGGLLGLELLK